MTDIFLGQPAICMTAQNLPQAVNIIQACNKELMNTAILFTILGAAASIVGMILALLVTKYYPDFVYYFYKP